MWRVAIFTAALLCPSVSLGHGVDELDPLDVELGRELAQLEHGSHHHHQHHHHYLHHKHHQHKPQRFLGLLLDDSRVTPLHEPLSHEAQVIPGRNAAVTKKLKGMQDGMSNVEKQRDTMTAAHKNLESEVDNAIVHLNSVASLKEHLAQTEVQMRVEERKLKKLQEDRRHLDKMHDKLEKSLHTIMMPKVEFAQQRLSKRKHQWDTLQAREGQWKDKRDKFHQASLAMLEERKTDKADLEEAIVLEQKAHHTRKADEKKYEKAKKDVTFNIQGYRYSDEEFRAAHNKEKLGHDELDQADVAVKRLTKIMEMEEAKVDDSTAIGKNRVDKKIHEVERLEKESKLKLDKLRSEYDAWQTQQQSWANEVGSQEANANSASKDYVSSEEKVLGQAREQVVLDEENDSDWGGWDEWPGNDNDNSIA